jgi:hypothetical protein
VLVDVVDRIVDLAAYGVQVPLFGCPRSPEDASPTFFPLRRVRVEGRVLIEKAA